jgi:tetratricopeptide (TPR) repeat protein
VDQVSIFKNEISTLTLRPSDESLYEEKADDLASRRPTKPSNVTQASTSAQPSLKSSSSSSSSSSSTSSKNSTNTKKTSKSSQNGNVVLAANVDNARLSLDGKILGAGNLKYKNISPGKHRYEVSKDGYASKSGTIDVPSGKDYKLKVNLSPLAAKAKEKTYDEEDFYYSGIAAYKDEDYKTAISDFSEAIKIKPSYAEAYFARGEANIKIGYPENRQKAHDDYIRAAEIYQFRNDYNSAIMAYRNAIEVDPKSITAHLGRAKVYLKKGEEIAAIADFEVVTDLDKRNADAYFGLGEARFRQGYFEKAIKHFKDARSLNPDNPSVYQYLMLSYMGDHDYKNVKKTFEKYQEIATEDQMNELYQDKKFSAVMEIINRE